MGDWIYPLALLVALFVASFYVGAAMARNSWTPWRKQLEEALMTWNHRILRRTFELAGEEHVGFSLHEVYYDDDGSPTSWTKEPVGIGGDTYEEAVGDYAQMALAFAKPVLEIVEVDGKQTLVERSDRE